MVRQRVSRQQRLLEVGMDLFCNRSYEEVSIDDIAGVADISKGLLYYYFPTKHDFYVAVVRQAAEQLLRETEPDLHLEPRERLRIGINAYFSYARNHARAYIGLVRGGVGVDTQVATIMDNVRQTHIQQILQCIEDVTLSPTQLIALNGWSGFVESACIAWLQQGDISQEALCEMALSTFNIMFRMD